MLELSNSPVFILLCLFACAYAGLKSEKHKKLSILSGVVVAMISAAVLSNFKIIPNDGPIFDIVWDLFVPLSIPLLLFKANLRKIWQEAGPVLTAYVFGAIGSIAGAIVAFFLVDVGAETYKIISMFCATYIGGSLNFVSVSQALDLQNRSLFLSGNAADNVTMAAYFMAMGLMAKNVFLNKFLASNKRSLRMHEIEMSRDNYNPAAIESTVLALVLSFGFFTIAQEVKKYTGIRGSEVMVVTVLALIFANVFPNFSKKLHSSEAIARIFMMVFFAVIGASSDILLVIKIAPVLFIVAVIIVSFQITFALFGARIFRLGLPEMLVACNANAGGPATAAAIASANRWPHLVAPGVLVGTLGYAAATFIGTFLAYFLSGM